MSHNHNLTRVAYRGDKVVIVSGPVPAHIAEGAVAQEEMAAVPGKVERPAKPQPAPPVAPTPTKEGK